VPAAGGASLRAHGPRAGKAAAQSFVLALLMGATAGAACTLVRLGFRGLQWCFTGHSGMPPDAAAALSWPWRVTVPIAGGLLGWLVLRLYRRSGRARPAVDYVEAVRVTGGQIPFTATAVRTLSSALSVATGAAIGREGSMIQFATSVCAFLGSRLGKRARPDKKSGLPSLLQIDPLDTDGRVRVVAWGVAAGVAAAYQAPIAGAFFASEIAIGRTRPRELPALLTASVAGWAISRPLLGPGPLFPAPASIGAPGLEWLWLLPMAALLGLLGPAYQWLIRQSLRAAQALPVSFAWAGGVVGLLSLATPLVWGNGDRALFTWTHIPAQGAPGYVPGLLPLAGIVLARLLATCFCVGAGVAGGVFTPTLFAGASAGLVLALCLHVHAPLLFVVAGVSCLLAAVTHAPLMTAFMTVELTGKWNLLPVLYLLSLLAWSVARSISGKSLYAIATSMPRDDERQAEKPDK
jgi:CIC family chloride channel protein